MRALALLALLTACDSYVELHNTADRIWIMEKDGRFVLRCYDMVPPGAALKAAPRVFCKEAWMYGTMSNPIPDAEPGK